MSDDNAFLVWYPYLVECLRQEEKRNYEQRT